MIDLTPLDVRNKRGDFKKGMRGYDPQEVDVFLELVAERLEALVRENIQLRDRTRTLQEQVDAQAGREQAVQDALVTAQELRKDMREQSQREADHLTREAESEARRIVSEAEAEARARVRGVERQIDHARDSLQDMERRRTRFLQEFRGLLQRELDVVEVEEERTPLEDRAIDLDLGAPRTPSAGRAAKAADPRASDASETEMPGAADGGVSGTDDAEGDSGPTAASEAVPDHREDAPSSLELELMAGAAGSAPVDSESDAEQRRPAFPDVPDLETVLAEAGIDEVRPPDSEEISPPPADAASEDRLKLLEEDEGDGKR